MDCRVVGCWRIIRADRWEREFLDGVAPAALIVRADGRGGIAFGSMHADLEVQYRAESIFFTWSGFDELDEARGFGSAELQSDGTLEIEVTFDRGGDALLKAERIRDH